MFKMIDHWKHLSRLVSTPRWALKLRCIQKKFYSYFEKKGVYYSIVELHFLTMTTFIYTKWEQGQLNLHIFKKTFVHPLVNDQVKVHWALKNAVRILKKNSENDGCQIWRKVVQKQLPIIINGFIFRDYLVKIKTKVVPTELPSYICQVGQKIRCHTLFEKKRRSDYFAVTFGLLQVICVKWAMSNHILHSFSLKSTWIHGRVSIDLHMLTTWICLQGPCLNLSSWQHLKLLAQDSSSRMSHGMTRHLTTKCDKNWVKVIAKNLIWISELHTSFHTASF